MRSTGVSGLTRAASASALLLALAGLAGCSSSHKRPAAAQSAAGLVTSTAPGPSSAVGASAGTTTTVPASLAATGAPIPPPPERGGSPAVAPAGSVALGTKPARVVLSWPLAYVLGQPQGDREHGLGPGEVDGGLDILTSAGSLLDPAFYTATVTMLSNGKVLVFGGQDAAGFPQPAAALFE